VDCGVSERTTIEWNHYLTFRRFPAASCRELQFPGSLSVVRGIFTSLIFLGFAMTMLLMELGVDEILSFFLGQVIVVGSTYIYLRIVHPEILKEVKKEYIYDGPSHGC
jgi:hypothetical protein